MDEINNFIAVNAFAESTRYQYKKILIEISAYTDMKKLSAADLATWLDSHTTWGSSIKWLALCAVRSFLKWRYGARHPALKLKIRRCRSAPQRAIRLEQARQLLASFDTSTAIGRRDLAITGLFLDSGLRLSEMCRLEVRYLDLESHCLTVICKGGQWGAGWFGDHAAVWLSAWLTDREGVARHGIQQVFVSMGTSYGKALTTNGLRCIVRKWGERLGIKLSPHDFRRSMASIATVLGAPEDLAMKAGRWRSHSTFRGYTVGATAADFHWFPTDAAMES